MKKIKMAQIASEFKFMCVNEVQNISVLVDHQCVSACIQCEFVCMSQFTLHKCMCLHNARFVECHLYRWSR